jgi:hypothetical protein
MPGLRGGHLERPTARARAEIDLLQGRPRRWRARSAAMLSAGRPVRDCLAVPRTGSGLGAPRSSRASARLSRAPSAGPILQPPSSPSSWSCRFCQCDARRPNGESARPRGRSPRSAQPALLASDSSFTNSQTVPRHTGRVGVSEACSAQPTYPGSGVTAEAQRVIEEALHATACTLAAPVSNVVEAVSGVTPPAKIKTNIENTFQKELSSLTAGLPSAVTNAIDKALQGTPLAVGASAT